MVSDNIFVKNSIDILFSFSILFISFIIKWINRPASAESLWCSGRKVREKKYGLHSLLELNEHWKLKKDTKLSDLHFNMQSVIKTQFIGKHFVSTVTKLHLWESQLS